ncbi:hypothetical protein K0M31_016571 [Melipona bicolor]|uniref:Uncharacterized protein n=1 Tax=Melipona bicolor TaxID=60889 RepID=A0AA40KEW2_9HYME|nr:hypothetical protein K0M31_016571 [Melipona bicolor]
MHIFILQKSVFEGVSDAEGPTSWVDLEREATRELMERTREREEISSEKELERSGTGLDACCCDTRAISSRSRRVFEIIPDTLSDDK